MDVLFSFLLINWDEYVSRFYHMGRHALAQVNRKCNVAMDSEFSCGLHLFFHVTFWWFYSSSKSSLPTSAEDEINRDMTKAVKAVAEKAMSLMSQSISGSQTVGRAPLVGHRATAGGGGWPGGKIWSKLSNEYWINMMYAGKTNKSVY